MDGGTKDPVDGPSFVHLAVCVGTDVDGQPISLIDRICLNNDASPMLMDTIQRKDGAIASYKEVVAAYREELAERENGQKWTEGVAIVFFVLWAIFAMAWARKA